MPNLGHRPVLTRDTYEKLVAAFRERPGHFNHAARSASCDPRTAKRCWAGPPYRFETWAVPIKGLLEEEAQALAISRRTQEKALAQARADAAAAGVERARKERADEVEQERQLLRVARSDVLSALAISAELVPAMRQVAKAVAASCQPDAAGNPPAIAPVTAMGLLGRFAQMVQKAVGAAEVLVQLARTERGEANLNVAVGGPALTEEEALQELEAVLEVLGTRPRAPTLLEAGGSPADP